MKSSGPYRTKDVTEIPFCFPIQSLANSRLVITPFDFAQRAELFVEATRDYPELFSYVAQGPFSTTSEFACWYKPRIESSSTETLFAILVNPQVEDAHERFAGVIGLQNASPANGTIEIGSITILPAFHRTFVTCDAVGLLLLYTLDSPPTGLALQRCQWQSHALNEASKRVALRMGFKLEGVQRFQRVVPVGKVGNEFDVSGLPDPAGVKLGPSRDSAVFAHYCDDWIQQRGEVIATMERQWLESHPFRKIQTLFCRLRVNYP